MATVPSDPIMSDTAGTTEEETQERTLTATFPSSTDSGSGAVGSQTTAPRDPLAPWMPVPADRITEDGPNYRASYSASDSLSNHEAASFSVLSIRSLFEHELHRTRLFLQSDSFEEQFAKISESVHVLHAVLRRPGLLTPLMEYYHHKTLHVADQTATTAVDNMRYEAKQDNQQILSILDNVRTQLQQMKSKLEQLDHEVAENTRLNQRIEELTKQLNADTAGFKFTSAPKTSHNYSLLECKSILGLKTLGANNVQFKAWIEDLEQVLCELRPYLSEIFEWISKNYSTEVTKDAFMRHFSNKYMDLDLEELWVKANADLWTVLFHKTQDTARTKLRACQDKTDEIAKPGIEGLRNITNWYSLISESSLATMRSKLLRPGVVSEKEIITAIEKYEMSYKHYRDISGGKELEEEFREQAIRNMLPPGSGLQMHVELHFPSAKYEKLKEEIRRYALIHVRNALPAPSPVNSAEQSNETLYDQQQQHQQQQQQQQQQYQQEQSTYNQNLYDDFEVDCFDAQGNFIGRVSAGKAGLKGKGKGKGKEKGPCYNCGKMGHLARDCWAPPNGKSAGKGFGPTDPLKGKGKGKDMKGNKGYGKQQQNTFNGQSTFQPQQQNSFSGNGYGSSPTNTVWQLGGSSNDAYNVDWYNQHPLNNQQQYAHANEDGELCCGLTMTVEQPPKWETVTLKNGRHIRAIPFPQDPSNKQTPFLRNSFEALKTKEKDEESEVSIPASDTSLERANDRIRMWQKSMNDLRTNQSRAIPSYLDDMDLELLCAYLAFSHNDIIKDFARANKLRFWPAVQQFTMAMFETDPSQSKILMDEARQWGKPRAPRPGKSFRDALVGSFEVHSADSEPTPGWQRVSAIVDSGACNHVGPITLGKQFPLLEAAASRDGQHFSGADGSKMRNLGCKDIEASTDNGDWLGARIQIADKVKRTLLSVGKLVDSGNTAIFDNDGSYIVNKQTGESTQIYKENGVFKLGLWIPQGTSDPFSTTTGKIVAPIHETDTCTTCNSASTPTSEPHQPSSGFLRRLETLA